MYRIVERLVYRPLHAFLIRQLWGTRCSEFLPGCHVCERWAEHDWMFGGPAQYLHNDDFDNTYPLHWEVANTHIAEQIPLALERGLIDQNTADSLLDIYPKETEPSTKP